MNTSLVVEFYTAPVLMGAETEATGSPVYRDLPHIRKYVPGDSSNIIERVAKVADWTEFPEQWAQFQARQEGQMGEVPGRLLREWPLISPGQLHEAAYHGVRTVEHLAGTTDTACARMGAGFMVLRQKAQEWLRNEQMAADRDAIMAESKDLRAELEALRAQVSAKASK